MIAGSFHGSHAGVVAADRARRIARRQKQD